MNPQNPLAQLRDVHAPDSISWFPMAMGWWIVLALVLGTMLGLMWLVVRGYKASEYKRDAQKELEKIKQEYVAHKDNIALAFNVSRLLRRVALYRLPRHQVASKVSKDFAEILLQLSTEKQAAKALASALGENLFSETPALEAEQIIRAAKTWIGGVK